MNKVWAGFLAVVIGILFLVLGIVRCTSDPDVPETIVEKTLEKNKEIPTKENECRRSEDVFDGTRVDYEALEELRKCLRKQKEEK